MRALVLFSLIIIFVNASYSKTCSVNSWDVAYAHLFNNSPLGPKAVEPVRPGEINITCPKLVEFEGQYISKDNSCVDTKISLDKDGVSLRLSGYRSFIGINTGKYVVAESFTELTTVMENSTIRELMVTRDGRVVSLYELSKVDQINLKLKIQNQNQNKVCYFVK